MFFGRNLVEPPPPPEDDEAMPAPKTPPRRCTLMSRLQHTSLVALCAGLPWWGLPVLRAQVDRPPELISKTGGAGALWTSVAELAAAAKAGNSKAMAQYGELQLAGDQVPKNVPAALDLLRAAARKGEASAVFRLGRLYDEGSLLPQDRARALVYFRAAAAGGIPEALYNLGASYASGRGVKRDYVEGLAWMILATQAGIKADGEKQLRGRIESLRRSDWIQAAQRRAPELSKELASKTVLEWVDSFDAPGAKSIPPPAVQAPVAPKISAPIVPMAPPALAPGLPAPGLPRPESIPLPELVPPKPVAP